MGTGPQGQSPDFDQHFAYFQFRAFPSASHSTACAMRLSRVASVLASVIHSTYSRLKLVLPALNVFSPAAFAANAALKKSGTFSGGLAERVRNGCAPSSLSLTACLTCAMSSSRDGKSATVAILPKWFIPSLGSAPGNIRAPFQKPKEQWALNADIPHSMPLYSKWGRLHFIVSLTSGQAAWMVSRRVVRMGWAKAGAAAM